VLAGRLRVSDERERETPNLHREGFYVERMQG
jgi:hypothetical protein